jgi:hypothetical protein
MPVLISMLRGVSVGGHSRIETDALRALYASLRVVATVPAFVTVGSSFDARRRLDCLRDCSQQRWLHRA